MPDKSKSEQRELEGQMELQDFILPQDEGSAVIVKARDYPSAIAKYRKQTKESE